MVKKEIDPEVKKAIDELIEKQREDLYKIFAKDTFNLTFDEREKLIDSKIDIHRCEILQRHIEKDPDGISKNNYTPDETVLCACGTCATLSRDENGDIKAYERKIKTKHGVVQVTEYGYSCPKCRKVFFPSKEKTKPAKRKL